MARLTVKFDTRPARVALDDVDSICTRFPNAAKLLQMAVDHGELLLEVGSAGTVGDVVDMVLAPSGFLRGFIAAHGEPGLLP